MRVCLGGTKSNIWSFEPDGTRVLMMETDISDTLAGFGELSVDGDVDGQEKSSLPLPQSDDESSAAEKGGSSRSVISEDRFVKPRAALRKRFTIVRGLWRGSLENTYRV